MNISGRYGEGSESSFNQHFTDLSAGLKKYQSALHTITSSNSTVINGDKIHSISIAAHLRKTSPMEHFLKDRSCTEFNGFNAWKLMHTHPKWAGVSTTSETSMQTRKTCVTKMTAVLQKMNQRTAEHRTTKRYFEGIKILLSSWSETIESGEGE